MTQTATKPASQCTSVIISMMTSFGDHEELPPEYEEAFSIYSLPFGRGYRQVTFNHGNLGAFLRDRTTTRKVRDFIQINFSISHSYYEIKDGKIDHGLASCMYSKPFGTKEVLLTVSKLELTTGVKFIKDIEDIFDQMDSANCVARKISCLFHIDRNACDFFKINFECIVTLPNKSKTSPKRLQIKSFDKLKKFIESSKRQTQPLIFNAITCEMEIIAPRTTITMTKIQGPMDFLAGLLDLAKTPVEEFSKPFHALLTLHVESVELS